MDGLAVAAETGERRRRYLHESPTCNGRCTAVADGARPTHPIASPATPSATPLPPQLLQTGCDSHMIKNLPGHSSLKTTMIDTHCMPVRTVKSRRARWILSVLQARKRAAVSYDNRPFAFPCRLISISSSQPACSPIAKRPQ